MLEAMQPDDRSFAASISELEHEIPSEARASFEKYRQKSQGCKGDAPQGGFTTDATPSADRTPKVEPYWQSVATHMLLEGGKRLRFGPEGKPLTDADRATREWQQQLTDYLDQPADCRPSHGRPEQDDYH